MNSIWLDERDITDTPCCFTDVGRVASACDMRFCTFTVAISRSVPSSNVMVSIYEPSEPEVELRYIMPSTPLTCCSMGTPTVSATVCASAPGYIADTITVGGVMSGYCATGRLLYVSAPASTIATAMTIANIGRSIKNFENMMYIIYMLMKEGRKTDYFVSTGVTVMPSRTLSIAVVT